MTRTNRSAQMVSDRRIALHNAYMFVVENWAVGMTEIADHLSSTGDVKGGVTETAKQARSLLTSLERKDLLASMTNDGEKIWQSYYDIENTDHKTVLRRANADFDEAFPQKVAQAPAKKGGATGAKYTDSQISAGLKARRDGKSNKQVAAAAGVKSPSYFAKVLKAEEVARAKAAKRAPAKRHSQAKRNMKNSPVKIGARKGDGPQGLKNLLP